MARVLEKVHRAGILHRDVKPSNIGYTAEGEPKLLDFGLARIVGEASPGAGTAFGDGQSVTGFAGTPLYMCPEAFDMARPGAGFDLWSLSVVAFEAASGAHPFERANSTETLRAIRRGFDDDLRASIATWPETVSELFAKLLSGDPDRRPASAAEMAEWIADVESGGAGWAAAR
jgi:serine/threonine-protein kinase